MASLPPGTGDTDQTAPGRRRRVRLLVVAVAMAGLVAYVLVGFPSYGLPGRAGIGELHRVEAEINRASEACGLEERATVDWLWGQVDVPSANGIVGDMPMDVALTREELGHATGSMNFFWVVCPRQPIR